MLMKPRKYRKKNARRISEKPKAEARGEARGEAKGIAAATLKIVRNLLRKKTMSYEEIADTTDTTLDEVLRIAKDSNFSY